ncbi:MAG: RpiB/LacA/LacB family sugar-phosphate isomerase [Bacteroidota bacterium]
MPDKDKAQSSSVIIGMARIIGLNFTPNLQLIAMHKIGICTDHGGFDMKTSLKSWLEGQGYEVVDYGAYEMDPKDDFPDFVIPLARAQSAGEIDRGICICGSGVGACIAANKVRNVRACMVMDTYSAAQGVEHDDMNVICLGGRIIGIALAQELVKAFLGAEYAGLERQRRRMGKVAALEK